MTIRAEVHSDDYLYQVRFDAQPYFEKLDDEEIVKLAEIGFGGDYEADNVAFFFEDTNPDIGKLFDYVRRKEDIGFECYVWPHDALAWISEYRPHLIGRIEGTDEPGN